jgi:WD40 repeat protein
VAFSSAGNLLASASRDGLVHLWEADGREEFRPPLRLATVPVNSATRSVCLALSADGRDLATALGDGIVEHWNLATGKGSVVFKEKNPVTSLAFSPNGLYLAWTTETDKVADKVSLWDLAHQENRSLDLPASRLAFSPDSMYLAAALKNDIRVCDLTTGRQVLPSLTHDWTVTAVDYSSDGRWLASASKDKTVKVWNASTGQELHSLRGHGQYVYGIAFSPDAKRLASASIDQSVKVWDLESGQEVLSLVVDGPARSVAFNAAGNRLACGSNTGKVWVWVADRMSER